MHVQISYSMSFLHMSPSFNPLVFHSWNHNYFVLLHWRSDKWNIQDDMEISQASVSLSSLSAMNVLVPRSSTPPISQALGLRTQNSLTKAHPHGLGHAHSGTPQWQMELAQREMPWLDAVHRPAASYPTKCSVCATVPWCKWKSRKCALLVCLHLWGMDQRLQVEVRPISDSHLF